MTIGMSKTFFRLIRKQRYSFLCVRPRLGPHFLRKKCKRRQPLPVEGCCRQYSCTESSVRLKKQLRTDSFSYFKPNFCLTCAVTSVLNVVLM